MEQHVVYKYTSSQILQQELEMVVSRAKQLSDKLAPILLVPSFANVPPFVDFDKSHNLAVIAGYNVRVLSARRLAKSMVTGGVVVVANVPASVLTYKLEEARVVMFVGNKSSENETWLSSRNAVSFETNEPLVCSEPSAIVIKALDWLYNTCNPSSNFSQSFDEDRLKTVANVLYEIGEQFEEASIFYYCKKTGWLEQMIYTCIAVLKKAQSTKLKVVGQYSKESLFSIWGVNPKDMQEKSYIKSLVLESMWGYKTVKWNSINEDVNILVGINGVGKTTLLDAIYSHYSGEKSNGKAKIEKSVPSANLALPISYIRTADTPASTKGGKESRLTQELNGVIMQNKSGNSFYNYFMRQLYESQENSQIIKENTQELFDMINEFFKETGKTIEVDKSNNSYLSFHINGREDVINHTQLSSGEKQLLLILIRVFLQEKQPAILLMDEPEQSLHIRWQQYLIEAIRELNPNCQLIITTHSPSILSMGWGDKVVNMEEIVE